MIASDPPLPRDRTIALVGLMGAGKSSVGRRLADALGLPFRDGDDEIERAAGMTVPEIFELYGETPFREAERRVIARLLAGPPHILATGGGAFMDPTTRALMRENALVIWLKADVDILAKRVARKGNRPLLQGKNPRDVLAALAETRYPIYAEADITVESGDLPHAAAVNAVIAAVRAHGCDRPNDDPPISEDVP
jgi:shikimate kinase